MDCMLDHIAVNMNDEATMVQFYVNVLELAPERVDAYRREEVPFPSVRLNADTIIDLFPKKLWQNIDRAEPGPVNLNHVCLSMDKPTWQGLLQRLAGASIAIEEGPASRWGAHGSGTSIYFRDPENNLIEARFYP